MVRPTQNVVARFVYGLLAALTIAALTGATKIAIDAKLDTIRFERDSITNVYKFQRTEALLYLIDSTTKRIEAHEAHDHAVMDMLAARGRR